jgi:UDP-N-acetylglucosamine 2-epimerase (non-hydrolysing)
MNSIFFDQLNIPHADYFLNTNMNLLPAGSMQSVLYKKFNMDMIESLIDDLLIKNDLGQISCIKDTLTKIFNNITPDLVIVFGDVTSTLASALTAYNMHIPIAHIESGLRSGDLTMPEEVNRILVDHMSSYYFISEPYGIINLLHEGFNKHLYIVGNTMIDTLYSIREKLYKPPYNNYILVTLHRPSNVDNNEYITSILDDFKKISEQYTIIFPIHPRTKSNINVKEYPYIHFIEPQGYIDFISLIKYSHFVITDSGGIQEETTALEIPCFTLRKNTERPVTLIENGGTNSLINNINEIERIDCHMSKLIKILWDGNTALRITDILTNLL